MTCLQQTYGSFAMPASKVQMKEKGHKHSDKTQGHVNILSLPPTPCLLSPAMPPLVSTVAAAVAGWKVVARRSGRSVRRLPVSSAAGQAPTLGICKQIRYFCTFLPIPNPTGQLWHKNAARFGRQRDNLFGHRSGGGVEVLLSWMS